MFSDNVDDDSTGIDYVCENVWPALAVMGGIDRGLRIGGQCLHKPTGHKGIVMGSVKMGLSPIKIQLENSEHSTIECAKSLNPCEPESFNTEKFNGLTVDSLKQIIKLSGITNEIRFPKCDLTEEEQAQAYCMNQFSNNSKETPEIQRSSSESQIHSVKTVDALYNELVSNIMNGVCKINPEKTTFSEQTIKQDVIESNHQAEVVKQKLLKYESKTLKLSFIQYSALKTLSNILKSEQLTLKIFVPLDLKDSKDDEVDEALRVTFKSLMHSIVDKSIENCKMKHLVNITEIDRAISVLHSMYIKCKSEEEFYHKHEIKRELDKLLNSDKVTQDRTVRDVPITSLPSLPANEYMLSVLPSTSRRRLLSGN